MTKKILSLLCALAMLVSMMTIGMIAASAEGETATGQVSINLLDSTNIKKWTVTRGVENADTHYAGAVDLTSLNRTDATGVLTLGRLQSKENTYVDFAYSDALNLGKDFSILMTSFLYTNIDNTKYIPEGDSYVALNLGEYSIRVVRLAADATQEAKYQCYKFRVALYKNDEMLYKTDVNTKADIRTTMDVDYPSADYNKVWGSSGTVTAFIKNNITNGNGKTAAEMGKAVSIANRQGFNDVRIVMKDGVLSFKNNLGETLAFDDAKVAGDDYSITSFDMKNVSLDNIKPSVRCNSDKCYETQAAAVALFRLEGTIGKTPAVVTFNANEGTCDTATATVADGKLASLPTPTREGYTFIGWYTEKDGGTKVTADTVFADDATVYARWTEKVAVVDMDGLTKAAITYGSTYGTGTYHSDHFNSDVMFTYKTTGSAIFPKEYKIKDQFDLSFNILYGHRTAAGPHEMVLTLGDLELKVNGVKGTKNTEVIVSYKGTEICKTDPANATNSEEGLMYLTTDAEWDAIMDEYVDKVEHASNYGMALCIQKVTCSYINGEITVTIGKPDGTAVKTATGTITGADFSSAKMAINVSENTDAGRPNAIYNFVGTYATTDTGAGNGSGSGSGSGTGTGTGSGSKNPSTGDTRNIALPIGVAVASVAVAGATLLRKKRV